ncbi:MAG: serine hydrolase [Acidobacteria bacterium]|nr:serine hydrolase [Acidobacteriota bacterium]
MQRRFKLWILWALLGANVAWAQTATDSAVPTDAEIRAVLADRIDVQKRSVGIVVSVIEPAGRRIVAYGNLAKGDERPLDGDTVFEIGSITKVFTSLILADMVQRGEAALDDPVAKYLPEHVKVPERGGRSITLEDLSRHISALPRLPSNLTPADPRNPYADYSVEQMYEFLSAYELPRDIGSKYEYSNLGVGLLGHALARRAGTDYETLVKSRICEPLGMESTSITLSAEMEARLAAGHNNKLEPASNWDLPTLAGAGALRSSTNDLLRFLAANLGYTETPLAGAMASLLSPRTPTGAPNIEVARAWHIQTKDGVEFISHGGGTGGYRTVIGYSPQSRVGVVVLSNSSTPIDDLAQYALDRTSPLMEAPKEHTEISVDPKIYAGYVGRFQLAPEFILTVSAEDGQLFTQATGQPKVPVFPESETEYFLKVVDAQITFHTDADGRATSLTLHQNRRHMPAKRMEGEAPPEPAPKYTEVEVDPKLFDGYVGRYQLAPNFILTITAEDDRLFAQATDQPKFEVFAKTATEFFFKIVDALITFATDESGRATALTLHQNGMNMPAKRLE